MPELYKAYNGAMNTTAALAPVTTSTAIKTMLQLSTPSTMQIKIVSWGISFDGTAAAVPVKCELIETDVAATGGTAHVAAGLIKMNADALALASALTLGTGNTGFSFGTEGTTAASRLLDYQQVQPTNQYAWEWSLGREPIVAVSKFLRVRVTVTPAVNCVCWVMWEE